MKTILTPVDFSGVTPRVVEQAGELAQALGATVSYSPEFNTTEPHLNLLRRIAEAGSGQLLPPLIEIDANAVTPFQHDRIRTYQPRDLWEWLLKLGLLLFVADVGVRRIYLDRAE